MRRLLVNAISIAFTSIASLDAAGRDALFPLESGQGLRLHNVAVEAAVLAGKKGIKVTLTEETVRRLQAMNAPPPIKAIRAKSHGQDNKPFPGSVAGVRPASP